MSYYEKNKEKILEYRKKYYEKNFDKISKYNSLYYLNVVKPVKFPKRERKKRIAKPKTKTEKDTEKNINKNTEKNINKKKDSIIENISNDTFKIYFD